MVVSELVSIISVELIIASIFFAFLASMAWLGGHVMWLTRKGRMPPSWMLEWFDLELLSQAKQSNVYFGKGLAWIINIFFGWWWSWPNRPNYYREDNVMLVNIGGIILELTLFFLLTGFFRWVTTREDRR